MQGWKLFKHALRMVMGNWQEALKIFLVPSLLIVGVGVGVAAILMPLSVGGWAVQVLALLIIAATLIFVVLWTVVAWHRFVLLEEVPQGWLPELNRDRMLAYFGQGILIWLLAIGVLIPVGFLFYLLQTINAGVLAFIIAVPLFLFLGVLWLSVSIILPAAAIGKPLKVREALEATYGAGVSLLLLLLLVGLLQGGLELLTTWTAQANTVLSGIVSLIFSAFLGVLNVSILTTLYGHYIEGRSVD